MNESLKVAFNASQLLGPLTGIGQYSLQLARALRDTGKIDLRLFYLNRWSSEILPREQPALPFIKSLVKRWVPRPYETTRALQQRAFNRGVSSNAPDLYHEPSILPFRFDGPTVITVHDLSWIRYPQAHPVERVRILEKLLPSALATAARLIVDSQFVRDEVIGCFGVDGARIDVVPIAARDVFQPRDATASAATLARLGLADHSYFLCVGTLEPRKNLQLAVRAHALLPVTLRRRCPLVVAGGRGWNLAELDTVMAGPQKSGELILAGFVSDDELASLYSRALVLSYPSRYEGFGLPPLEAMACGTPVILSDAASLPEVGGTAAVYHAPDDVDALSRAMQRMAEDPGHRLERAQASRMQAARFSWAHAADLTIAAYRRALSRS